MSTYMAPLRLLAAVKFLTCSRLVSTLSAADLNQTIMVHVCNGKLDAARNLFDGNPISRNVVSWNSIIAGCIRHNEMHDAQELFDNMPVRDVVSWNTMLSGFRKIQNPEQVHRCFLQMRRYGQPPNEYTFSIIISAFTDSGFNVLIPQLHAASFLVALHSSVFVGSALMRAYTNLPSIESIGRVFDEIFAKNVASWNALVLGYMNLGLLHEARAAFEKMPEKNVISWTILVDGLVKNKQLDEACSAFNRVRVKNVVSWTAMIRGYVQCGRFIDALKLFVLMVRSWTCPNHFTFSSVLDACAGCSSLRMGKQIHSSMIKSLISLDVILSTSLVDMYAKCGDIDAAVCIFESMPKRNLVSWNSIIGCYAMHGFASKALEEFERMKNSGTRPDEVTFVNVLSACGHGGLVEEGERNFYSMGLEFGIQARMEHYGCMVDLYGRSGHLEKAEELITGMPFEPDVVVWGALLGGCAVHSSSKVGKFMAEGIYKLEQNCHHPACYSMLAKIHGENGEWRSMMKIRNIMRGQFVKKQKAGSWLES